jgi:hypothetical protein
MPTIIYRCYDTNKYFASAMGQCIKYPCGWRVESDSVETLKTILATDFPFNKIIKIDV